MAQTKLTKHQNDLSRAFIQTTLAALYLGSVAKEPECQQEDKRGIVCAITFLNRALTEVRLRLTPESIKTIQEEIASADASLQYDNISQLYMKLPQHARDVFENVGEDLAEKYSVVK